MYYDMDCIIYVSDPGKSLIDIGLSGLLGKETILVLDLFLVEKSIMESMSTLACIVLKARFLPQSC